MLLGKYYIYDRKCVGSLPSLRGFIANIRRVYNIELHIAKERDKLATHFKKWEKLVTALRWLKTVSSTYIGWVVITTLYHLMLQPWYQKTSQSLVNTLQSFF